MKLNPNPQLGYNADVTELKTQLKTLLNQIVAQLNSLTAGEIDAIYTADTAAPTTGAHKTGDFIRNTAPTGTSPTIGWICTASGTPGTWVAVIVGSGGGLTIGLATQLNCLPLFL